jgi:Cd(II)/Pb(II)-responsive transcriptional regulator
VRIGELAERTSTPVDTIRYYEKVGVLPDVDRSAGNYRTYGSAEVQRLNFIRRCRALDMSLEEIRTLLHFCDVPQRECVAVNAFLDQHIEHVEERLRDLRRLAQELRQLRGACKSPGTAGRCEILQQLNQPSHTTRRKSSSHRSRAHSFSASRTGTRS